MADLDFADDVALVGVSDSEVQENLYNISKEEKKIKKQEYLKKHWSSSLWRN